MSGRAWIVERAEATPEALALVQGDRRLRWRDLLALALARAQALAAQGIGRGDLVAVRTTDPLAFAGYLHATQLLGARLLPIHARLTEGEVAAQREAARPRVFHDAPEPLPAAGGESEANGWAALRARPFDEAATSLVLFTSGTGGRPKAACLSARNLRASAEAAAAHLGVGAADRWLACLPLYHVGGLSILARSVLLGAPVFLQPGFDAGRVWRALAHDAITHVSLVPTMLHRLLEAAPDRPAPEALRVVLLGGAAAAPDLVARARALGWPVCPTYGLTEACSQVATALPDDADPTAARPLPGTEVRIRSEAGAPAHGDGAGEILVRGPTVFQGYLDDPEASGRALRQGWLHTGDRGVLLPDGRLRVLGRTGDLLVSGGENVSPLEVEGVLEAHPQVAEAAVLGLPDPDLGERVVALVVPAPGAAPDPGALVAWCRARLAGHKVPREVCAARCLPRNTLGKLLRGRLPAAFLSARTGTRRAGRGSARAGR